MNAEADRLEELRRRFFDVQMPRRYCIGAFVFRVLCLAFIVAMLVVNILQEYEDVGTLVLALIVAAGLATLPSLPKALIEQRNRLRGLKDGTMQEFLDLEKKGKSP